MKIEVGKFYKSSTGYKCIAIEINGENNFYGEIPDGYCGDFDCPWQESLTPRPKEGEKS